MKLFCLMIILLLATVMSGEPVSVDKAREIAGKWQQNCCKVVNIQAKDVRCYKLDSLVCFYVFDYQPGFVIVAADDAVKPILGYSADSFVPEKIEHPAIDGWFEKLKADIAEIKKRKLNNSQTRLEWEEIGKMDFNLPEKTGKEPLIKTKWGGLYPYNMYSPLDSGILSPAGCLATAMAQVMKYHGYPKNGCGSNSYSCETVHPTQILSADFGKTLYDWDKMPLAISEQTTAEQKKEAARLQYHCGVAINMEYSKNGSGAGYLSAKDAMISNFRYKNTIRFGAKREYGDSLWVDLLKRDLDRDLPVIYSGIRAGGNGGHAFICDGYDANELFHFNWGFSGQLDGYFQLSNLNPDLPQNYYPYYQRAILGIEPLSSDDSYIYITEPAGTTKLRIDSICTIKWESNLKGTVKILFNNEILACNVPNTGSCTFAIKNCSSGIGRLLIVSEQNEDVYNYSKQMVAYSLQIQHGGVNNTLYKGEQYSVYYDYESYGLFDNRAKIELFRNNVLISCLNEGQNRSGFLWLVPDGLQSGGGYRLKITSLSDSNEYGWSDNDFVIADKPALKIISPDKGQICFKSRSMSICWLDTLDCNLKIDLYKGDLFNRTIYDSVTNRSGNRWINWPEIDAMLESGDDYRIKIGNLADPLIFDYSPFFTITGTVIRNRISGVLSSASSPYIICDSAVVMDDAVLEIQAGARLYIDAPLIVKGRMTAIGEKTNPVVFCALNPLCFIGSEKNSNSLLSNCVINSYRDNKSETKWNENLIETKNYKGLTISDSKLVSKNSNLLISCNSDLKIINNEIIYSRYGLFFSKSTVLLTGNLIHNKTGEIGRAISLDSTQAKIINNTMIVNESNSFNSFSRDWNLVLKKSSPLCINNIFRLNRSYNEYFPVNTAREHIFMADNQSHPVFYNCNISYGIQALSTVDSSVFTGEYTDCNAEYPEFSASSTNEFSFNLSDNSPCINNGSMDFFSVMLPDKDLAGNPRIFGGCIDIGALENISSIEKNRIYDFELKQNYPNPFNNTTTISFTLQKAERVELRIYNIRGEAVHIKSINGTRGDNLVLWQSHGLSSGIYICQIKTAELSRVMRMTLLK